MVVEYLMAPFEKEWKDQGVTINRPTGCDSSFFLSKSLYAPTDNNSNTINSIPTVSLQNNTPVCPDVSSEWRNWFLRTVFWHATSKP